MKVMIVKELMTGDVSPVAMFVKKGYYPRGAQDPSVSRPLFSKATMVGSCLVTLSNTIGFPLVNVILSNIIEFPRILHGLLRREKTRALWSGFWGSRARARGRIKKRAKTHCGLKLWSLTGSFIAGTDTAWMGTLVIIHRDRESYNSLRPCG